jgi:hypothetical protein
MAEIRPHLFLLPIAPVRPLIQFRFLVKPQLLNRM